MNKKVQQLSRDLIVECHERGLVACVCVADKSSGETIRSADGQLEDVIRLISTEIVQISMQTGNSLKEVMKAFDIATKKAEKAYKEAVREENRWKGVDQ